MVGTKSAWKEAVEWVTCGVLALLLFSLPLYWAPTERVKPSEVTITQERAAIRPNLDGVYYPLQYSQEDLYYMTEAIYFEARSEPLECQEMVAQVIMVRVHDWYYPNTVKGVIWAKDQFSYTHDGETELMYNYGAKMMAQYVAHSVLSGLSVDTSQGSLYYFNPDLANPDWQDDYTFVTKCGKHAFYKRKETRKWS
jgi:spore germination cell wall hydrolase CwlJ-like protein